jgi:[acyl-carrier-protein] S-malonyltransferase
MKTGFIFPGQGSQYVGMGSNLYDEYEEVRALYKEASDVLGYNVAKLSFKGPVEELDKTFRTQPCLLTASIAAFHVTLKQGIKPDCVAGHSLGEYSALVAAQVLTFADALKIVEMRGKLMQEAVPEGQGQMAAILGFDRDRLIDICQKVPGIVSPANFNCPAQIVISGQTEAVQKAIELAKQEGAKRAVALAVSVPSHCALMEPVGQKLAHLFSSLNFSDPSICFVNNADARVLTKADEIKQSLIRQLSSSLLWEDSIMKMIELGVDTFIEIGPGKVLSGLMRKINREKKTFNIEDKKSLLQAFENLN